MNIIALILASTVATHATTPVAPVSPESCGSRPCAQAGKITQQLATQRLNDVLAAEGMSRVRQPLVTVRAVGLDGDPSTAEALLDVLAPEHCGPTLECPTLVVQLCGDDQLRAMGHGRWLQPLTSRSNG